MYISVLVKNSLNYGKVEFSRIIGIPYSEPCQTSKVELSLKIANGWKLLTISAKSSILDVWQGSEYTSV